MAFNSVEKARAELAARRKAKQVPRNQGSGDSDFWHDSNVMGIDNTNGPDTVFNNSSGFSETVARDVSSIVDIPHIPSTKFESIEPLERSRLMPNISKIAIMVSGEMQDNNFLDLIFIRFSTALPSNKLLQLRDEATGIIYVWNGESKPDGTIKLIQGEKGEDGRMHYRKEYNTNNGKIKLTYIATKYD